MDDLNQEFYKSRRLVRSSHYLSGLSSDYSKNFLAEMNSGRFASVMYERRNNIPYLQPRGGVATLIGQEQLMKNLVKAGADFIPLTIDSHTRQNDYEKSAKVLKQELIEGRSLLNGYPLLAHGVLSTKNILKDIDRPISLRHGTPDARLLVEAALDSGITEIEGGGLCYCLPYSRSYPIDKALLNWQYVDKLCAELSMPDRLIHRESFGPLTATMVPPFMVLVVQILELLLAAEQGVKSFAVSYGQTGSMLQDYALAVALKRLPKSYLKKIDCEDVTVRYVYHQWMGAFPYQRYAADALITQGAIIASVAKMDKIVVKTRMEALGIPDIGSNSDAVAMSKYVMELSGDESGLLSQEILDEAEHMEQGAMTVLDKILEESSRPTWVKIAKAVNGGVIDIPFSPHINNSGNLWTVRGLSKSIRVLDPGKVPLSERFLKRENKMIGNRANRPQALDEMLADINIMLEKRFA